MKIRKAFFCLTAALVTQSAQALNTGDIAFAAFNGDRDAVAFVALDTIPAGDVIYFNDNEWNGRADGRFDAGNGPLTNDAMFYAYRITIDAGKKFFRFGIE